MNQNFKMEIYRIAETHRVIKPLILHSLENFVITEEGEKHFSKGKNYLEIWQKSMGENFFDMGNFIRLGSVIENW